MFHRRRAHANYWPIGGWSRRHHTKARTLEFLRQATPLVGTLVFGAVVGQATTLLVSKLGTDAVAATSAISAATVAWSGAINAMFSMVIAVRVGYHLGRGDGDAARRSFWLSTGVVSAMLAVVVVVVAPLAEPVLSLATSDRVVARDAAKALPVALLAMTLGVLNSLCTGGAFSGQGRQTLVTVLSFFVDIPLSVGGVAAMVLFFKTDLHGVYVYGSAAAALELLIAYGFVWSSDWKTLAADAKARQR
jgi:MATE family multidrug resistance protein